MRTLHPAIFVAAAVLVAGCVDTPDQPEEIASEHPQAMPPAGPFFAGFACPAVEHFALVPQSALAPHVPANWTYLITPAGVAYVRLFSLHCENQNILFVTTPMRTDAASQPHAGSTDVVLEMFSDNGTTVERLQERGVPAHIATFSISLDGGAQLQVQTDSGTAWSGSLTTLDAGGGRDFAQSYTAQTDTGLVWFWGWENHTSQRMLGTFTPGSASIIAGVEWADAANSYVFPPMDVAYRYGTTPK